MKTGRISCISSWQRTIWANSRCTGEEPVVTVEHRGSCMAWLSPSLRGDTVKETQNGQRCSPIHTGNQVWAESITEGRWPNSSSLSPNGTQRWTRNLVKKCDNKLNKLNKLNKCDNKWQSSNQCWDEVSSLCCFVFFCSQFSRTISLSLSLSFSLPLSFFLCLSLSLSFSLQPYRGSCMETP